MTDAKTSTKINDKNLSFVTEAEVAKIRSKCMVRKFFSNILEKHFSTGVKNQNHDNEQILGCFPRSQKPIAIEQWFVVAEFPDRNDTNALS